MDRVMSTGFLFLLTITLGFAIAGNKPISSNLIATQTYSDAFNDISAEFDDVYWIKTQDKGRVIVIYCNTTYCYKDRNSLMSV